MAMPVQRKKRMQLKADEREILIKRIKIDRSENNLLSVTEEWNRDNPHRRIDVTHLRRLSTTIPKISSREEFWETVCENVAAEVAKSGACERYEPPAGGIDYSGYATQALNPDKVPLISPAQLKSLCFDATLEKYNNPDADGSLNSSTKLLKNDFRDHFQSHGIAYGRFSTFVNKEDKAELDSAVGQGVWEPSDTGGPWKTVGDQVRTNTVFQKYFRTKHQTTFSDHRKADDRINPKFDALNDYFLKRSMAAAHKSLLEVLLVCEALYRTVADWLPTMRSCDRTSSRRRLYPIAPEMISSWFSMLTCISGKTGLQREHMDDVETGVAALWGLAKGQYIVVWLWSFEMNLEQEFILEFYEFVMSKKPHGWSDEAFWNLVAGVHLENNGFGSEKRPSPVKIPLEVGHVLLIDFMVVHSGMPFADPNLRGHLYWPKVSGRGGSSASDLTLFPWDSSTHFLYPCWRFLAEHRRQYE